MGPCWVAENKNKLYAAPKKERIPTNIAAPPNQVIEERKIKISTISRGIAIGGELEFADEVTLGRSIALRVPYTI